MTKFKGGCVMHHYDLLQKYLSNLAVLNIKMHNIHWNVVGKQFIAVHEFTEGIYDKLFEQLDEVAELLKMKGVMPLSTVAEYLENSSIEEIKAKDFAIEESLEIVKKDLEAMKELATTIRNAADEEGDFETVAMFEDFVAEYSKNIWFVDAMLK
jgi:starvation-inducible DNA-binding protein